MWAKFIAWNLAKTLREIPVWYRRLRGAGRGKQEAKMREKNEAIDALIEWAKLFEPMHQSILKTGGACCSEYDRIWHGYKDTIRPLLKQVTNGGRNTR